MLKTKGLSEDIRSVIISKHKTSKGYKAISKDLGIPVSRVRTVIKKSAKHGTVKNLPGRGGTRSLRRLVQMVEKTPTSKVLNARIAATLTFKLTYSILCGLSIIASLVLPPPQPQGYSPPGSFVALVCCCSLPWLTTIWIVTAPLLLVGSSGVERRSSWTSAVTSPQSPSLVLDLFTGPPDSSLFIRMVLFLLLFPLL